MTRLLSLSLFLVLATACQGRHGGGGLPPTDASTTPTDGSRADGSSGDGGSMDGSDCTCGVDGSSVRIACGDTQCVGDSQYVCSTGDVRGLLIRTGPCTDAGAPDMGGSGVCGAACSACGTMACDQCNQMATTAETSGCSTTYAPFADCLAGSCTDVTPCLSPFSEFAACACPSVSPRLSEEASSCGVTVPLTCADMINQVYTVLCEQAFQMSGCAALSMTPCTGA